MPGLNDNLTDSQRMIVIQNTLLEQQSKIDRHHKFLIEGNGTKPASERLNNLEAFMDTIKFWQRTLAVAIVLQTLTLGITALIYFIKLYPLLEKISNQP